MLPPDLSRKEENIIIDATISNNITIPRPIW